MSYNILEQAIVDAKALREAALKNAETAVLEKYAEEVRGAIDLMLEEETETLEEHDLMSPEAEVAEPVIAAAEDEALCGCPDAQEKVEWELNLNDLRAMSNKMPEGEPMMDPALEEEAFLQESEELDEAHCGGMHEDAEELDEEIDLVFEEEELEEGEKMPMEDEPKGKDLNKDGKKGHGKVPAFLDEDIELDEEMVREIVEELVSEDVQLEVDIKPTKRGWAGTSTSEVMYAEEKELARLAGTEAREKHKAVQVAMEELSESKKASEAENQKLKQLIYDLKGKLDESILSNAKLLYTNQTLTSASLNERQKNRIVESIRDADTIEEAKVIYETLQSAVGSSKRTPKSLREAINRPSISVPSRKNNTQQRDVVVKERFQRLAGISKTD